MPRFPTRGKMHRLDFVQRSFSAIFTGFFARSTSVLVHGIVVNHAVVDASVQFNSSLGTNLPKEVAQKPLDLCGPPEAPVPFLPPTRASFIVSFQDHVDKLLKQFLIRADNKEATLDTVMTRFLGNDASLQVISCVVDFDSWG